MPDLEIVIINWNTLELTRDCLRSVFADIERSGLDGKVWVVDNNSSDGSLQMIRTDFPQVALIENKENVGFARANNQVLRHASAPLQLLLNSDTVVHEGALKRMVDLMDSRPEIAAVGPKLVYPDGHVQRSYTRLPSVLGELKYCMAYHFFPFNGLFHKLFGYANTGWDLGVTVHEVEVLSAACLMVRKSAFDKVGLLAEDYFLFSEENDLFCRMKRAGFRSAYLPTAVVTHVVGASRRKRGGIDSQLNFLRSRLIFFKRFHPGSIFTIRLIYALFLRWSLMMARLSALLKRNRESEFVALYRRLLEVLAQSRQGA